MSIKLINQETIKISTKLRILSILKNIIHLLFSNTELKERDVNLLLKRKKLKSEAYKLVERTNLEQINRFRVL
jgi:hypothetical protein